MSGQSTPRSGHSSSGADGSSGWSPRPADRPGQARRPPARRRGAPSAPGRPLAGQRMRARAAETAAARRPATTCNISEDASGGGPPAPERISPCFSVDGPLAPVRRRLRDDLVDRGVRALGRGKQLDHPLDLPPAAEMDDVAEAAAAPRPGPPPRAPHDRRNARSAPPRRQPPTRREDRQGRASFPLIVLFWLPPCSPATFRKA